MRCPQCRFENIPGQDRCLRCGSILAASAAVGVITPPRMARWKKPVRIIMRRLPHPEIPVSPQTVIGLIFSIIPGLSHFIDGRFREVRWLVLGWPAAMLAGVFFYGGVVGFALLGIALGIHGRLAFDYALIKKGAGFAKKLLNYAMVLTTLALLYTGIRNTLFGDYVFCRMNLTIPGQNVGQGDVLLARPSRLSADALSRGALIIGGFHRLYGFRRGLRVEGKKHEIAGQVVALPGEKIEIINGRFAVNGVTLDAEKFPVPQWLVGAPVSVRIPPGAYFVSTGYGLSGYGMKLTNNMISSACILRQGDIKAVAVMRWLPPARRGFLRADQ